MALLDISSHVDRLVRAAVPERTIELGDVWGSGDNRVRLTGNSRFEIGAWFGFIQLTETTLRQIWLFGFVAWEAIRAYSGIFAVLSEKGRPFVRDEVARSHGQGEADAAFDRLLASARALRTAGDPDSVPWPPGVPRPTVQNDFADRQDKAAFDLLCIAGTYIFLHEIQHVRFEQQGSNPSDPRDEEHECDRFARDFLLGGIDEYARSSGEPADAVLAKRALGIAVAKAQRVN